MPKWSASYTNCSSPGAYFNEPVGQTILIAALSLVAGGGLASLGGWGPGLAVGSAGLCISGVYFCNWWLNIRLVCLGTAVGSPENKSAVGVIYAVDSHSTAGLVPSLFTGKMADFLGDFDTDWSFNLLLWPFVPQDELPGSLYTPPWPTDTPAQLIAAWPATYPPFSTDVPQQAVQEQIDLIYPQATMKGLGLGFSGQDVMSGDEPKSQAAGAKTQHFLIHCEVEGSGMLDLRNAFWILFAIFLAAAAVEFIPVVGIVFYILMMLLAWLWALFGSPNLQNNLAAPPAETLNSKGVVSIYNSAAAPGATVDMIYVFGRWVYDSFHQPGGSNELHPVHFILNLGPIPQAALTAGSWPTTVADTKCKLDIQYGLIDSPLTAALQALPENSWSLYPLLDGCQGQTPYPQPPPPPPEPLK